MVDEPNPNSNRRPRAKARMPNKPKQGGPLQRPCGVAVLVVLSGNKNWARRH